MHNRIICGFVLLTASAAAQTVNASEFGLREGEDATPALRRAVAACRERGARRLVLPKGTYHFHPNEAFEKYAHISNNTPGLKRVAFPLLDMEGFELDGGASRLVFHGQMVPVIAERCSNLVLRNFSIDWDKPFMLQGKVVAADPASNTFDIEISKENVYEIWGDELISLEKPSSRPFVWLGMGRNLKHLAGWEHNINWNRFWDPVSRTIAYGSGDYQITYWNRTLNRRYQASEIRPGLVRLKDATMKPPPLGWVLVVKGKRDPNRLCPAIQVSGCRNVRVEDVTIHHAGGMGLIAERTDNITMKRLRVLPAPGSTRLTTTSADATHFSNCRGLIHFDECHFENQNDDGTNIHGVFTGFARVIGRHTIGLNRMHEEQLGFDFAAPGDQLRFSDPLTLEPYATFTAKAVREINEEFMEVDLVEVVEGKIRPGSKIDNVTWQPDVLMENCTFKNNLARSLLLSQEGRIVIRNNRFIRPSESAIWSGLDANLFHESGLTRDILIENNYIEDPGSAHRGTYAFSFFGGGKFDGEPTVYHKRNIRILNNTLKLFAGRFVSARNVDGLEFRGNRITQSGTFPDGQPGAPSFLFELSRNITVEGNTIEWTGLGEAKAGPWTSNVVVRNNRGLPDMKQ